jgi:Family of unknown function (DUF5681)
MSAERTAPKQRGRPFVKGCSGNPQGRPKGARNAATILAEQLLEGEAEALIRKLIAKAKRGDMAALRLCIDRIVPPRRERPLNLNLPQLASVHDVSSAIAAIVSALANGELGATEAADLMKIIEGFVRALEASDLQKRLLALEQRLK